MNFDIEKALSNFVTKLVLIKDVNFDKMTPDTIMSDRLTSSILATPTESRIITAQFMSDPKQCDSRAT